MHADLPLPLAWIFGFALTLARISGVFAFVPMPGAATGPVPARVVIAVACTFALSSKWPLTTDISTPGALIAILLSEAVLGLAAGVVVGFIAEAFVAGAQVLSLPAGYAYASTFDPHTNADSAILVIFSQLLAGMLFFAFGLDRHVIRAFAASLDVYPPGSFIPTGAMALEVGRLASSIFTLAIRLALPVLGLLLLVDIAMGVLGRLNPHIQIVSLSFPIKMLLSILLLASMLTIVPRVYDVHAKHMLDGITRLLLRR